MTTLRLALFAFVSALSAESVRAEPAAAPAPVPNLAPAPTSGDARDCEADTFDCPNGDGTTTEVVLQICYVDGQFSWAQTVENDDVVFPIASFGDYLIAYIKLATNCTYRPKTSPIPDPVPEPELPLPVIPLPK